MLHCPSCHTQLIPTVYEGVMLEACPSCGGHFVTSVAMHSIAESEELPRSHAERMKAAALVGDEGLIAPDSRRLFECPVCRTAMDRLVHAYDSGVWIDQCASHGIWLDAGELRRLEAFAEAQRHGFVDQDPWSPEDPSDPLAPRTERSKSSLNALDVAEGVSLGGYVLRALAKPVDWLF